MTTIRPTCMDILKKLEERTKDCSLEEEQRFVRKAHDEIWRKISELSLNIESYNSHIYRNIYSIFGPEVEQRRKLGKNSGLSTSLNTCPEKRPRRFYYPDHVKCLDDLIWEIFHNQMRGEDPERNATVLLMCVESVHGYKTCLVEENGDYDHAEINALRFLKTFEPKKIDMYISRSPCLKTCLPAIEAFIEERYFIRSFRIRFSSVHAHYDPQEMTRLWKLKKDNPGRVDIDVFDEEDWDHLEKHLSRDAYRKLRREFKDMRKNQTGRATCEADEENSENENSSCGGTTSDYSDGGSETDDTNDKNTYKYDTRNGESEDEDEELSNDDTFPRNNSKRKYQNNYKISKRKKVQPLKYDDEDDDDVLDN